MNALNVSAAPHIHAKSSTRTVMLDVIIALIPAVIASIILFGIKALWIILTCVATTVLSEFLFNLICKKKQTIFDLSAVLTGLLLALNLSTRVPLWQCVIGSVFAIIVVKCLFGGIGKNITNPAITARVFMLLTFGATVGGATFDPAHPELEAGPTPLPGLKGNTLLENINLLDLFLGRHGGTIGETCIIALLIGYAYLVVRGTIKWYVPLTFIAVVFFGFLIATGKPEYALAQILSGGLFLGAIFMATDYVTTPLSNLGRVIFCLGAGLITFFIRYYGPFPEGVSISILAMNLLVPLIDKISTPRTLGGIR